MQNRSENDESVWWIEIDKIATIACGQLSPNEIPPAAADCACVAAIAPGRYR